MQVDPVQYMCGVNELCFNTNKQRQLDFSGVDV